MNARDLISALITVTMFASAYPLIKVALLELPPVTVAALRFILASALMISISSLRFGWRPIYSMGNWFVFASLATVQIFLPNLLQNIGLLYTTAAVSSVLQSTTPIFTMLLSFTLLNEALSTRKILGVAFAMAGTVLLSTDGNLSVLGSSTFLGNILQISVAASYAIAALIAKATLEAHRPMILITNNFLIGAIQLSLVASIVERGSWHLTLSLATYVALVLLSVLYCLALVLWYDVMQRVRVSDLYYMLFLMPVLSIVMSVLLLGEPFGLQQAFYSFLTILGLAIAESRS